MQPTTITDSVFNQLSKNSLDQNTSVDTAELKRLMESSNYRTSNSKEERSESFLNIIHFSKGANNKLWIINLKEGTNGFKKAKLAASLKDGNFSLIFISYDYDTAIYKKNDFSTYTGTTSIFNYEMKKIGEFFYRKGRFINSSLDKKPAASMIVIHAPDNTDWCLVWPPLCEYQGGEGTGGDVTTLMASPDGAGGSGGSGQPIMDDLNNILHLNSSQFNWLSGNPNRAVEIYLYLQSTTLSNKNQISIEHINQMMTDNTYFSFVVDHGQIGNLDIMWWNEETWLDNNFKLNLEAGYDHLTYQEKQFVHNHPVVAWKFKSNSTRAMNQTSSRFPYLQTPDNPYPYLNTKADAFRHAYWMALNTLSEGADLAKEFGQAHESETPALLYQEKDMDLFNNDVGINAAILYWGQVLIEDDIYSRLVNGELKYLNPLNYTQSPEYDPINNPNCSYCRNGFISGTTQLVWSNQ